MNKELMFNEMLESAKKSNLFEYVGIIDMITDKDWIILVFEYEGTKITKPLIAIPSEFENIKLHGNTKNKLAVEFVNKYSLDYLLKLNEEYYNKRIESREKQEQNKYLLENLVKNEIFKKFEELYKDEIKVDYFYIEHGDIEYEIKFNYKVDKLYIKSVVIRLSKNFNKKYSYKNDDSFVELTENEIIKELESIYIKSVEFKNIVDEENKIEQKKELEKIKIRQTLYNLYNSTDNKILLLKFSKKSFVAHEKTLKYAVGTGKSGKFYNNYFADFANKIIKKGIDKVQYILLDKDFKTGGLKDEQLNSMNWNSIRLL